VGLALRAAREQAGVTVEQVSAETRLRGTVIRDIEKDSYRSSGGAVYARGHVKSIARALQIADEPFLELFDRNQGTRKGPPLLEAEPISTELTSFGGSAFAGATAALVPERQGPRWGLAVAAALVVLIGIIGIGYATKSATTPAAVGNLPTVVPTFSPTPAPLAQTPDPSALAAKPVVTGAQLRVRLIDGSSWVSVSDSTGKTVFEGTLRSGEFRDFSDPTRLKVLVGNAMAVNLNCDGHDSGPAGRSGMVATFSCTDAGLTRL